MDRYLSRADTIDRTTKLLTEDLQQTLQHPGRRYPLALIEQDIDTSTDHDEILNSSKSSKERQDFKLIASLSDISTRVSHSGSDEVVVDPQRQKTSANTTIKPPQPKSQGRKNHRTRPCPDKNNPSGKELSGQTFKKNNAEKEQKKILRDYFCDGVAFICPLFTLECEKAYKIARKKSPVFINSKNPSYDDELDFIQKHLRVFHYKEQRARSLHDPTVPTPILASIFEAVREQTMLRYRINKNFYSFLALLTPLQPPKPPPLDSQHVLDVLYAGAEESNMIQQCTNVARYFHSKGQTKQIINLLVESQTIPTEEHSPSTSTTSKSPSVFLDSSKRTSSFTASDMNEDWNILKILKAYTFPWKHGVDPASYDIELDGRYQDLLSNIWSIKKKISLRSPRDNV